MAANDRAREDQGAFARMKEIVVMSEITLSATPKGNGYQATITFPTGVAISSAETYPSIAEAITAAALKLLEMPERLTDLDGAADL
ncbi:hypothetical protein [Caulobacter segnis]|uniref:hypothetical protein n=1 Tax=Caulobacter segnis TaxID=88688 RepID=UPI001CBB11F3|nr:hypothetical protein [Caulobacter segnis]UAL10164.1 hypothetical protein K8940_20740 [Caulobacter segnis]